MLSGMHFSCIPAFPFDPPTQSNMYNYTLYLNTFAVLVCALVHFCSFTMEMYIFAIDFGYVHSYTCMLIYHVASMYRFL